MDLLENAVESIRVGVEDYKIGSHGRLLASVRSIHAGILLLYKEALRRKSPRNSNEVLVKANSKPRQNADGTIDFIGVGFRTVNTGQIKKHFDALGITTDWKRFEEIARVRNEIEHHFTKADKKALAGLVSNAFIIARKFMTAELERNPLDVLGDETWAAMLEISEVYEAEKAECEKELAEVEWHSAALAEGVTELACPNCGSTLLAPGQKIYDDAMSLHCRVCGDEYESSEFVPAAIAAALQWGKYLVDDDGADEPYVHCPNCGYETYVVEEEQCAWCGESVEHTCACCGNEIPPSELSCSPNCAWCDHMMSKDD